MLSLNHVDQTSIIIMYAPGVPLWTDNWNLWRLNTRDTLDKKKGHTVGQEPYVTHIFMFKNIWITENKQKQQLLSSMIALRDVNNTESVCT